MNLFKRFLRRKRYGLNGLLQVALAVFLSWQLFPKNIFVFTMPIFGSLLARLFFEMLNRIPPRGMHQVSLEEKLTALLETPAEPQCNEEAVSSSPGSVSVSAKDRLDTIHCLFEDSLVAARKRLLWNGLTSVVLMVSFGALIFYECHSPKQWFAGALLLGMLLDACVLDLIEIPPKARLALAGMAQTGDIRSIHYLIDGLNSTQEDINDAAKLGLIKALPQVTKDDTRGISFAERALLYRQLSTNNAKLVRAVLATLDLFDDAGALAGVEKLAQGKGAARKDPEIRGIAAQLLPVLLARRAEEMSDKTLLRPGTPNAEIGATALRPASYTDSEASTQLLRASQTEEQQKG